MLEARGVCDFRAAQSRHRSRRRHEDEVEQLALRAEGLIKMGELSHARQAPGNQATSDALQDPERRPAQPREPLPEDLAQFIRATLFKLGEKLFNRNPVVPEGRRRRTRHDDGTFASIAR